MTLTTIGDGTLGTIRTIIMVGDVILGIQIMVTEIIISRLITEPAVMHTVIIHHTITATTELETILDLATVAQEQLAAELELPKDILPEMSDKTPINHRAFIMSERQTHLTINQTIQHLTMVQPVLHHQIARDIMLRDTTTIRQPEATLDILAEATAEETTAEEAMAAAVVQVEEEDKIKSNLCYKFKNIHRFFNAKKK
jgi:hypothetical protein